MIDRQTAGGRDNVRLMFQEPRLLPWQRVVANVEVGITHAGDRGDRRQQAEDALNQVGLAGREHDWPVVLSGGQKQRVALARALVSHPRLLTLDEPLGALDALTRIEMQALVESVWREKGFTAIVVTHDVSEAVALADRVLLLEDGAVAMDVAVDLPRPRRRGNREACDRRAHSRFDCCGSSARGEAGAPIDGDVTPDRHPRESGDPAGVWDPAFAGLTTDT